MASFNEKALPPVPYKVPLTTAQGTLTVPWTNFFRQLWNRAGGGEALSNVELEELNTDGLGQVQTDVTALQASVASLTTTIANLTTTVNNGLDGLNQGRQL